MYYKIIVENLSERIKHIASQESKNLGNVLRAVDSIGNKTVLHYACDTLEQVADMVSTLETERISEVLLVEDAHGKRIDIHAGLQTPATFFNRYTLTLSA